MSKGYIIIATGTEYIKQAYLCAKSIKHTQTINNVSLLTGDKVPDEYTDVFDKIIDIPISDRNKVDFYRTDIRWKAFHSTPYKETVLLDTDMLFLSDISHWWNYLSNYDVCFTSNVRTYKNKLVSKPPIFAKTSALKNIKQPCKAGTSKGVLYGKSFRFG